MNEDIVRVFDKPKLPSVETEAQWIFFPNERYGFVAVVEVNKETWILNDNGSVTTGDYATILGKCIEIKNRVDLNVIS